MGLSRRRLAPVRRQRTQPRCSSHQLGRLARIREGDRPFVARHAGAGDSRHECRPLSKAAARGDISVLPLRGTAFSRPVDAPDELGLLSLPAHARFSRRSEEHTSELQSLMRISYAVFCLKKKTQYNTY